MTVTDRSYSGWQMITISGPWNLCDPKRDLRRLQSSPISHHRRRS